MKVAIASSILLLITLCAYLGLRQIDASTGGGIHLQSPNKEYTLNLSSLKNSNPLAGEKEIYAEITVHREFVSGEVVKKITVSPISADSEMSYRSLKNPIEWKDDSTEATVTTPDFTITVKIDPNQAR